MSSDPPPQTEAQAKAEAAAIRRRWITLGELLTVAAVVISGLTFWNSYSERSNAEAERVAAAKKTGATAGTLLLRGRPQSEGRSLALDASRTDQIIQSQSIRFPAAFRLSPVETTGDPRIESGWFADALRKARRAADQPDESQGDERLPIAITTRFLVDGEPHEDVGLYDVGYALEGRFLLGSTVRLRGLSLIERVDATNAATRLDRLWQSRQPTISPSEKK